MTGKSGQVHLLPRVGLPQWRIRLRNHARIGDDPLSVKGSKSIRHRRQGWTFLIDDWRDARLKSRQALTDDGSYVTIRWLTITERRVKECFLLLGRRADQVLPAPQQ